MSNEPIHILSLGAGVQSSTLALMTAAGEITPMPKAAIFADTQGEPDSVYRWLDWLEKQLPFPVIRTTRGSLADASVKVVRSKRSNLLYMKRLIPAFVKQTDGKQGMMGRTCTYDYKIDVLIREARKLCDWRRGEKRHLVTMWIGISTDEAHRMKPSRKPFIVHRWPLIEAGVSRAACLAWMRNAGLPQPPRSACVFCPFHSDDEWQRLKTEEPAEFAKAVAYEHRLQAAASQQEAMKGIPFLHESCTPLEKVVFKPNPRTLLERFGNECEGLCGV